MFEADGCKFEDLSILSVSIVDNESLNSLVEVEKETLSIGIVLLIFSSCLAAILSSEFNWIFGSMFGADGCKFEDLSILFRLSVLILDSDSLV